MKKLIIIGASSGIGREIASKYAADGWMVGITGRRMELLEEFRSAHPGRVFISCFDVQGRDCTENLERLAEQMGGCDLFIYNAGVGDPSIGWDTENELNTTRTNVNGFVAAVGLAFQYFLQQGYGQIAATSSVAAVRGNGWSPAYSASKSFISNYAEGLNLKAFKLKKDIVVTDIRAGFLDTKMAKSDKRFWVTPTGKAAGQIISAIRQRKRVVYVSKRWWIIAQVLKILPYRLLKRIG
jgi:short-subunit dehydrogenase